MMMNVSYGEEISKLKARGSRAYRWAIEHLQHLTTFSKQFYSFNKWKMQWCGRNVRVFSHGINHFLRNFPSNVNKLNE